MIKILKFAWLILCMLICAPSAIAQESALPGVPIVIQIIELEYADAEQLAKTLTPLLSPRGRITAYRPNNSLIIKDRKSIVEALVKVIKGTSDSEISDGQ